jgi:hypothetical protein
MPVMPPRSFSKITACCKVFISGSQKSFCKNCPEFENSLIFSPQVQLGFSSSLTPANFRKIPSFPKDISCPKD